MSDSIPSDDRPARLLVIAQHAPEPIDPCGVFGDVKVIPPDALAAPQGFAPDCIRADVSGAGLALRIGGEFKVPVVLEASTDPANFKRADCVLAPSDFAASRAIQLGADPASVVTLHERVDRDVFSPNGKEAPGPQAGPRLLTLRHENFPTTVAACTLAARQHKGLSLVHVGVEQQGQPAFVQSKEVATDAELAAWLRWADALLLPDANDHTLATARALGCGTPCIVATDSAAAELVTDHWDGRVVSASNTSDIARAIGQIADAATQARLAAPARTASEPFDNASVSRREAGIYRWLVRKEFPVISIVLPTFNRAALIGNGIRNVLAQDYPNLELIVVNDGSTDDTHSVLDSMASRLNDPRLHVIHADHAGLPSALNTGFEHAKGTYWTWTSDDNAYRPGALRAMARELELDSGIALVYADIAVRNDSGAVRLPVLGPPEGLPEHCCVAACFLYRADVARSVGKYDPDAALAEDYDFWLRFRHHGSLFWLRRLLYDYADTASSLTRTRFLDIQRARIRVLTREFGSTPEWPALKFSRLCRDATESKNEGFGFSSICTALRALFMQPTKGVAWRRLARALTPRPLLRLTRHMRGLDDH